PLAAGARALWSRAEVRAWALLAIGIFLIESLVFTLHSTRGSYFHSLGAFYPFGIAVAAAGAQRLLAATTPRVRHAWASGTLLLVVVFSLSALLQWDSSFITGARIRAAAVDAIPSGTFLAIDAAAWRWIAGRSVLVTPSDGIEAAGCLISRFGATSIVL